MRQELAEALRAQGNFSTVARAYILVGMASAGEDVSAFYRDIYTLLGEELPQGLRAALTGIIEGRMVGVERASHASPTPVELSDYDAEDEAEFDSWGPIGYDIPAPAVASDDPFDDVGFDFK